MDSMKKYFEYFAIIPSCGISKVAFFGKIKDWNNIRRKLKKFQKLIAPKQERIIKFIL